MKTNKHPSKLTEQLNLKARDQKKMLQEMGPLLVAAVRDRIEKKKAGPDGVRWKPWATSTAIARRREGTAGTGLLLRTGELRDSIEYTVQGPKVSVSTRLPYAQYLQNGSSRMPARPFLGMGKVERQIVQNVWNKWIKDTK